MNYVGIDISKYKHDGFIITDLGEVVNEGFSFTNNAEGFAKTSIRAGALRKKQCPYRL